MNSAIGRVHTDTGMRPRRNVTLFASLLLASLLGAPSSGHAVPDARLGIYFDAAGTVCSGTIEPGVPTEIYIIGHTPPGGDRISGAEFRFAGLPASWIAYPVPNAGTLSIGDPFAGGVNIAATTTQCQPEWSTFLMYTVLILATEPEEDVRFTLRARTPPSNASMSCPLITDCTSNYTAYCVEPSPCLVNMRRPTPCPTATTAVEPASWTAFRNLYR